MSIPDYQTLLLPILTLLRDGQDRDVTAVELAIAGAFSLTAAEREEMLPSGAQRTLRNRVGWSLSYLTKAALVSRPVRARYRITPAGVTIVESGVERLTARALRSFGGYTVTISAQELKAEPAGVPQIRATTLTGIESPSPAPLPGKSITWPLGRAI